MRKLYVKNDEGQIVKTYISRTDIEQAIIAYNKNHFQQAHNTRVYQDRIYDQFKEDNKRDKILKGELKRQDYDNKNVFDLLKLLKKPED